MTIEMFLMGVFVLWLWAFLMSVGFLPIPEPIEPKARVAETPDEDPRGN